MPSWSHDAEPRRHGKLALVLFAIAAAVLVVLVAANTARAADVRALTLEAKLPTGTVHAVYCTANTNYDYALLREREIYLDVNACAALAGQASAYSFPLAVHMLYHEWWHVAFQETDEKNTECGADAVTGYMLRTFWHETPKLARRTADVARSFLSPYAPLACGS